MQVAVSHAGSNDTVVFSVNQCLSLDTFNSGVLIDHTDLGSLSKPSTLNGV
mgnify:CR=1 FL=1